MSKALAAPIFFASCLGSASTELLFATAADKATSAFSSNTVSFNRSDLLGHELEDCPANVPLNRWCCDPNSHPLDVCPGGRACSSCPEGGRCLCPLQEDCRGSTEATPCCDPNYSQKCPSKPDIPCQACPNGISCQCPFFAEDCPKGGSSCCDPTANPRPLCPGGTVCQHCPNGHNCLCPRASPTTSTTGEPGSTKTSSATTTGDHTATEARTTTAAPEGTTTSADRGQGDGGGRAGLITLVVLGIVAVAALGGALVMRFRARQRRLAPLEISLPIAAPEESSRPSKPRSLGSSGYSGPPEGYYPSS